VTEILPDAILESFADISPDAPDVLDALKEIPADLANVLSLHYLCGKSCQEIAETTRQSIRTIKRKKAEAIQMLEGILRQ
jgi:DNA-directed RNA polymerase specialized sigma24 family protein